MQVHHVAKPADLAHPTPANSMSRWARNSSRVSIRTQSGVEQHLGVRVGGQAGVGHGLPLWAATSAAKSAMVKGVPPSSYAVPS